MSDQPLFQPLPGVDLATWQDHVRREIDADPSSLGTTLDGGVAVAPIYEGTSAAAPVATGAERMDGAHAWRVAQRYAQRDLDAARAAIARDQALDVQLAWLALDLGGLRRRGIAVNGVADLRALLSDYQLDRRGLLIDGGVDDSAALAMTVAALRGLDRDATAVDLMALHDPLAGLAREGLLPSSLAAARQRQREAAAWCEAHAAAWRVAGVDAQVYHDAGADAVQELAYATATGIEQLRALVADGRSVEAATHHIFFVYGVGRDVFLEIAKLRAARWLWAKVVAGSGGDAAAGTTRIVACTSAPTKSRRGPWINQLRVTTETFSSILGGADAIAVSAFDQAAGGEDPRGGRLAINTQHLLAEEAHLGRVADPAGGSGYVEALTESLARSAWAQVQRIEAEGGMAARLRAGTIADQVAARASERRGAIARREQPLVGTSAFALLDEAPMRGTTGGDGSQVRARPISEEPLADFAALVAAADGRSASSLAGSWPPAAPARARRVEPLRWSAPFELLHDAADRVAAATGQRPAVVVVRLGSPRAYQPQVAFVRRALAAGGVATIETTPVAEAEDAWRQRLEALTRDAVAAVGPPVLFCPGDADPAVLPRLVNAAREAGASRVLMAGTLEIEADDSIADGGNLLAVLARLHATLGITP